MNLTAVTVGTAAFQHRESTGIPAAAPAVVAACALQKLFPALFTQSIFNFANASAAIDTNRRPKQMIQTIQSKAENLLCPAESSCWSCPIHLYSKSYALLSADRKPILFFAVSLYLSSCSFPHETVSMWSCFCELTWPSHQATFVFPLCL